MQYRDLDDLMSDLLERVGALPAGMRLSLQQACEEDSHSLSNALDRSRVVS